jgi:hypothetical protein
MNVNRYTIFFLAFLLALTLYLFPTANAQEMERNIRAQFVFMPGYRNCGPAMVQGFGLGNQPLDVMLAQVFVESRSEKVIRAVRLSWRVYENEQGGRVAAKLCESPTPDALISGGSDLIELQALHPKERVIIGINPLPVLNPGKRTVYVDKPFIRVWDVKSVVDNDNVKGRMYMVVLYISEVRFKDGTQWTIKL